MLGKIYKITNKINGKVYIGQTTKSLKERFQKHCWNTGKTDLYHFNMAIKKAIKKYGKNNFTIELIEEVNKEYLDEREVFWISYYDSYNKGYNCTMGGQNGATRKTKLNLLQEEEIIKVKQLGASINDIAKQYSINKTSVKNIFKRHNLKMPSKRNLEDRISLKDFIKFLETSSTLSYKDIQNKFNICRSSVVNYIKKHNIEYKFSKSVRTLASKVEG